MVQFSCKKFPKDGNEKTISKEKKMEPKCERCNGWITREQDKWGMHLSCVNCGFEKAIWTISDKHAEGLMRQDENAGRRTGFGARNVRIMPEATKTKGGILVDPTEKEILENLSLILSGSQKNKQTI